MLKFNGLLLISFVGAAMFLLIHAERLQWPEEMRVALVTAHDFCMKEAGANEDHLRHCKGLHIPDEPTSKCYLSCMLEHAHFNETTKTAVILKDIHDLTDRLHEMTDIAHGNCDHLVSDDHCDQAWQRVNCYLKSHEDIVEFCHLLLFDDYYTDA